ncbi:MAG TPA: hypothetical protein V6D19_25445, partial [Stenomitos sp.]
MTKRLSQWQRTLGWSVGLVLAVGFQGSLGSLCWALSDSPATQAEAVYRKLPDFPLENQYVRADNNKQATESTLISRFIYYHTTVKGRSTLSRLDWKISLADYLGLNEFLQPETYPGENFLKSNPLQNDQARIRSLNRVQRDALVQALVDVYGGSRATGAASAPLPAASQARPTVPGDRTAQPSGLAPLAAPGSASLLDPSGGTSSQSS